MQKFYCYVDESGQDSMGKIFLVSIIILEKERDELREKLAEMEKVSKKGSEKWSKTKIDIRLAYMKIILESGLFKNDIFYSKYEDTKAYVDLTILSTAKAISQKAKDSYRATILVDGLRKNERQKFAVGLRKLKISVRKVRGVRDESDVFVRFADAIAGFMRDYLEGDLATKELFKNFNGNKLIKEI